MDSEEDVSARFLLQNVLQTEPPRSPVVRSEAQRRRQDALRSVRRSVGAVASPQVTLRHKLARRLQESVSRSPLPAKRSLLDRKQERPPLMDESISPRVLLKRIILTEAEASLVVTELPGQDEEGPSSTESSLHGNQQSLGGWTGLDLPDVSAETLPRVTRGLSRRRVPPAFNVTAFEMQLDHELGDEEEKTGEVSRDVSTGSGCLTLKTPFVDDSSERVGLKRRAANRKPVCVKAFDEAVQNRLENYESPMLPSAHTLGDSEWQKFSLSVSDATAPDITTDVIMCNTALYDLPVSMETPEDQVHGLDKKCLQPATDEEMVAEQEEEHESTWVQEGEGLKAQAEEPDIHMDELHVPTQREEEHDVMTEQEEEDPNLQTQEEEEETQGEEEEPNLQTHEEEEETQEEEPNLQTQDEEEETLGDEEEPNLQTHEEEEETQEEEPNLQTQEEEEETQGEEEEHDVMTEQEEEEPNLQTQEEEEEHDVMTEQEEEEPNFQTQEEEEETQGEEEPNLQTQEEEKEHDVQAQESYYHKEGEDSLNKIKSGETNECKTLQHQFEEEEPEMMKGEEPEDVSEEEEEGEMEIGHQAHLSEDGADCGLTADMRGYSMTPLRNERGMHFQRELDDDDAALSLPLRGEEEEEDALSEELSMKTPAFVRQKRNEAMATPTVLRDVIISPTPCVTKPRLQRKHPAASTRPGPALSKGYILNVFKHFTKTKVSGDVYPVVLDIVKKYFDRLSDDLETFAAHAKRRTIKREDVELLMRRQGFVTDSLPVNVLIENFLPLEYRKLLIPVATSGNKVVPHQRR
ncbi:centromere protein T-like isoform X1 [Denticeps clupeoides]|nr:centromere protein T-like isoform X1 [Denticeps clupeoides]